MTNKYSGLSDFEINQLVSSESKECEFNGHYPFARLWVENYSDAMSLMIDNKIALSFSYDIEKWIAKGTFRQAKSTNPCRAIAECYLLVKDAENNNG